MAQVMLKIKGHLLYATNNLNQIKITKSLKDDDFVIMKESSKRIVDAFQNLFDDCKKTLGITPPDDYEVLHQKYLEIYPKVFDSVWKLTADLENVIENLTKKVSSKTITLIFEPNINEEVRQVTIEMDRIERKKSNCFIATAAYGTPLSEKINTLRRFRDATMIPNPFLKNIVKLYYEISPPIANIIARNDKMRKTIRFTINLLIRKLKHYYIKL